MKPVDRVKQVVKAMQQEYHGQAIYANREDVYEKVLRAQPEFAPKTWIEMGKRSPSEGETIYFVVDTDKRASCYRGFWRNGNPWRHVDGKPDEQYSYISTGLWQPRYVPEMPVVKEDSIQERIQHVVKDHVFPDMARKIMDEVTEVMKEYDIKKKSS